MSESTNEVKKLYISAYSQHGKSSKSLMMPKGRHFERFKILTSKLEGNNFSVLDFGCGFGHLYRYLQERYENFSYTGVDIVSEFVAENEKSFPEARFETISSYEDIKEDYDYVLIAGTFNMKYLEDEAENKKLIQKYLTHLYKRSNRMLCVDFMTDNVDYRQPGAFHQNPMELYQFVTQNLSKRVILNQSVFPYEFSMLIFKNLEVERDSNIFEGEKLR